MDSRGTSAQLMSHSERFYRAAIAPTGVEIGTVKENRSEINIDLL
ncbi:hypothetical protein [Kamptonema sp. UHCC 0994]|nr:hypothetical protein [Kamptonema sp. UHCC 0994]MDF0551727.1 hypothetical protein [Kamptonema sp. UHCC 0994]